MRRLPLPIDASRSTVPRSPSPAPRSTARRRAGMAPGPLVLAGLLAPLVLAGVGIPDRARAQGAAAAVTGTAIVSRDVTAVEGDTLAAIARRELGTGGLAPHLAEFNELDPGATLRAGQIVRIPILVPARGETASVVFAKGTVTRAGIALERNALVAVGDVIVTGPDGFVSLEFSSGSVVNLQPDTTARVVRLSCLAPDDSCLIEIRAEAGELSSDVERRDGQPVEFRITTPYASAAVRGTVFDVLLDPNALRAAVTEGDVVVAALGQSVTLEEGFGSVTREGQPPGEPLPLLPAPVFRNVPARIAPGDAVAWFALADAVAYEATLARDPDGVENVAALPSTEGRLALPDGVPVGDYYLTLRAVDANGLPGFRSTARLGVAAIDPGVAPVEVRIERDGREFLVEVIDPPEGAPGFEVQVATEELFLDPLIVDVGDTGRAVLRVDADTLYARARTLLEPTRVSAFGAVASSDAQ